MSKFKEILDIGLAVKLFFEEYKSLREIAKIMGCSAMGVKFLLNRHGYDCSKETTHFKLICEQCKKEFTRVRCKIRYGKQRGSFDRKFCSGECYAGYLNHKSIYNEPEIKPYKIRQAQRLSRGIVKSFYGPLPKNSVVHHIDGNDWNMDIKNLMLLDSQKSHMMIHNRSHGDPIILFDGSKLTSEQVSNLNHN